MAKVALISVMGVLGAVYPRAQPVLGKDELKVLSRFCAVMCWPAMSLWSIGSSVEFGDGTAFLMLCAWCLFQSMVGMALSIAAVRVFRVPLELRNVFKVGGGWGNSAALTMVVFETLCEQPVFAAVERCSSTAFGYIMLYNVIWTFLWFAIGDPLCRSAPGNEKSEASGGELAAAKEEPPVQMDAIEVALAAPAIALAAEATEPHSLWALLGTAVGVLRTGPMVATMLGLLLSICGPGMQQAFFSEAPGGDGWTGQALHPFGATVKALASPAVCLFTMILAASLCPSPALMARLLEGGGGSRVRGARAMVPLRVVLGLALVRLVAVPVVCSAAAYPMIRAGYLGRDPLLVMVILLESAVPSAQMPIVFLSKYENHDSATKLAITYLFQYPASMFTFTVATTVALHWTQEYVM
jgi:predicted permease